MNIPKFLFHSTWSRRKGRLIKDNLFIQVSLFDKPIRQKRKAKKIMATQEEVNELRNQLVTMTETLKLLTLKVDDPVKQQQMNLMQESLSMLSSDYKFQGIRSQGVSLDKELLPHKFNATDIPKFKATDNPYFHLRAFETIMNIKGIDKKVFPSLFPLSLETVCQQWFFSLDKEKISTWDRIINAFIDRYKCNIQVEADHRQLEMLRQKENEGFTSFFNKWRETSANMVEVPTENESVRMFIKNLQEKYSKHLKYQHNLNTFKAVYDIGIEIEDDLAKQKAANNSNHSGWKGKKNDNLSSSENAHSSNNVSTFDLSEVLAMDNQGSKKQLRKDFTPIGMSYDTAFDRLHAKGLDRKSVV